MFFFLIKILHPKNGSDRRRSDFILAQEGHLM